MYHKRFAEGDNTLLGSWDRAFENQEIVLDNTVMGEATHWRDDLLSNVGFRCGVAIVRTKTDAVDLLVELGTVVVSV